MLKNPWRPVATLRHNSLPDDLRGWLLDCGSLTRKIIAACPGKFRVQIIDQRRSRPMHEEAMALRIHPAHYALIRQVYLLCDDTPWVYARSVIPLTTLRHARNHLGPLDTRPLGEVLFTDPTTHRGRVDIARITSAHPVHAAAQEYPDDIWGRRSIFSIRGDELLVAEIFLPALREHAQTGETPVARYMQPQRRCARRARAEPLEELLDAG